MSESLSAGQPRWWLALESSSSRGGVALLREGELYRELLMAEGLRHGRELLPGVDECLKEAGLSPTDLAGVSVSAGPGSYTGVRVGVMAAKAIAYGLGIPLTPVSSLAALAWTAREKVPARASLLTVREARRDEVYAAIYRLGEREPEMLREDIAMTPEEAEAWAEQVPQAVIVGDGLDKYPAILSSLANAVLSDVKLPAPSSVAWLGWLSWRKGVTEDAILYQPEYMRRAGDPGWSRDALVN